MRRWFLAYAALFAALLASWGSFAQLTATGIGGGDFAGGGGGGLSVDAVGTPAGSAGGSTIFDFTGLTVGTANGLVALLMNENQQNFSTVVWDNGGTNQSLTFITGCRIATIAGFGQVELWGLNNVTVTAGNKTLRATVPSNDRIFTHAVSLNGVNTTFATAFQNCSTNRTAGGGFTDTSISTSVTSASGHIVLAGMYKTIGAACPESITPNNTSMGTANGGISCTASNRASGGASVTMSGSWATASNAAIVGVDVSP